MVNFEDPFGESGEEEEVPDIDEDEEDEALAAPSASSKSSAPPEPAAPPSTPGDPSPGLPAEHERPPGERNWEHPEVIEKKGDVEYSNYTIREAYDTGTLTPKRRYRTKRGGLFSGLGLTNHWLSQHQVDRMKHDEAYRQAVFEKGPHGSRGQM